MTDFRLHQLSDHLYVIDAWMQGEPERLACYLFDTPERVLIECGPSLTMDHLFAGLEQLGIDDLAMLVVSHVHLDHAGAAGHVAARFRRARIGVHREGARHLVDPSRLWSSATRAYGGEDATRALWGPMEAVPEHRLLVLEEGDRVPLGGGRFLEVLYTPGHARHHIVFFDPQGGGAFIGDSVGVAYPHGHIVQPVTPPPDFDPGLVVEQLHRIGKLEPAFLGFAHFGPEYRVKEALGEAEERLWSWVGFVESLPTDDPQEATQRLRSWVLEGYREEGYPEAVLAEYDEATYWPMQAVGIMRWLSNREG
ncbi:MAG: MBL fold metallo-hydrolase [Actinomycetota bacterium]|nr:MBL fold metallo-hydrolase [Actinomycetota bacterium]